MIGLSVPERPESRRIALARKVVLHGFAEGVGASILRGKGSLEIGRAAAARRAWPEAFAALSEAARTATLDVADLELLGDAATWSGHFDASTSAREQAYAAYLSLGDRRSAARARSRFGAAKATAALGDRTGAAREARAALATFEQLGARLDLEAAALLVRDLSAPA